MDPKIRKAAIGEIIEARKRAKNNKQLRKFLLPKGNINFKAKHYFKMLDFKSLDKKFIESPPILANIPNEVLLMCARFEVELFVPNLPCHNTGIERSVKRTSEAAQVAIGPTKRQALILTMEENMAKISANAKGQNEFVNVQKL